MTRFKVLRMVTMTPFLLAASFATTGCKGREAGAPASSASSAPTYGCTADGGTLQIQFPPGGAPILCPSFPNTTPTGQPDWDYFAWNSFIAANWPAIDPSTNNNQRGFPDLTKNFVTANSGDLLVWETFKEKRELFQPFLTIDPTTGQEMYFANPPAPPSPAILSGIPPGPWNQALNYGPLDPKTKKPYDFPVCTDGEPPGPTTRRFAQLGKLGIDSGSAPDSLDETIEVASEALESPSQLCGGHTDNPCGGTPSPDCTCIQGLQVGPRVFKLRIGSAGQTVPVRYEVKVNYDYYQYVVNNLYWQYNVAQSAGPQGKIMLPFRTSAAYGPPTSPAGTAVTSYNAQGCIDNYSGVTPTSNLTPCLTGSMQIKTAWIPLVNGEDPTQYHTANAAIFKTQPNPKNPQQKQICIDSDGPLFGLVGMHIIQRLHQGAGGGFSTPQGGTYIFATWEHVDNDKAGFVYTNFLPAQVAALSPQKPPATFYPVPGKALKVTRRFPILSGTANVNTIVHNAIRQINPNSVWLNYQLIGTQFQVIDLPNPEQPAVPPFPTTLPNPDPTNIGQNAYLANTVVETNDGLQLFRGLPPNVGVSNSFTKVIAGNSSPTTYARNQDNVAFGVPVVGQGQPPQIQAQGNIMGGCMGCHGVAQVKGFSFSFILAEGQAGADVDTEEDFVVAPLLSTDFTSDLTDTSGPP